MRTRGIAIYRVEANAKARSTAVRYAHTRIDTPFRIVENDKEGQYCTTLIFYAWQQAGVEIQAPFEHLDLPFASGDYLMPHSLRSSPCLRLIYEMPTRK
jgi:hypothetical protein